MLTVERRRARAHAFKPASCKRNTLASAIAATLAIPAAGMLAANAQEAERDEILVTGSRIVRRDFTANSPIQTVDEDAFKAQSSIALETALNDLPQFVPSVNSTSNNPSNGGQANIDLRGLGTQRTLVLMNGRRVVPSNADGTVDINILPTPLIRSVEVISGGASSTYGSDALSGVVNFILNDSFEGVQFDAQYGVTDRGDGETESYSVTLGGDIADGRGNAVLSVGRSVRQLIYNADREFAAISGPSSTSPPGSTVFGANNLPSLAAIHAYFGRTDIEATGGFGFNDDGSLFAYDGAPHYKSPGGSGSARSEGTILL